MMTEEHIQETLEIGAHMMACAVTALGRTFTGKKYIDDAFVREVHEIGKTKYGRDWDLQMQKLAVAWWLRSGISEAEPDEEHAKVRPM